MRLRRGVVLIALFAHAALLPEAGAAYGWPVRPFRAQHLVTGNFGDPRGDFPRGDFHFGVDIRAPDGTPVYATLSGTVYRDSGRADVVGVASGGTRFEYWHVVPTVGAGEKVTAYRTVVGRIVRGARHVHFTEIRNGVYFNPLRDGALSPYVDSTSPSIRELTIERAGRRISPAGRVRGRVSLVADAFDWPALPVAIPAPDRNARVTPALVRWRIERGARGVTAWRTAADFRRTRPRSELFPTTYAAGTRMNRRRSHGIFRFYLARDWASSQLRNGSYRLAVKVRDVQGNQAAARLRFTVAN